MFQSEWGIFLAQVKDAAIGVCPLLQGDSHVARSIRKSVVIEMFGQWKMKWML